MLIKLFMRFTTKMNNLLFFYKELMSLINKKINLSYIYG